MDNTTIALHTKNVCFYLKSPPYMNISHPMYIIKGSFYTPLVILHCIRMQRSPEGWLTQLGKP
jgi:hypothetical protein